MSHAEQRAYVARVREQLPQYFAGRRVLEVGSLFINGSVREFFERCDYTGIDLGPGVGVDEVCHVCDWPGDGYECIISCEALEHDRYWDESLPAMWQRLVPGGLLLVTCAGIGRGVHGLEGFAPECSPHTLDYYRGIADCHVREALPVPLHFASDELDTRFFGIKTL